MKNLITIPLTRDKYRKLIINPEHLICLSDTKDNGCRIQLEINGKLYHDHSEFTASELYEEICSKLS